MNNKNISVLLSLYNKEKPDYLKEALISIFNQTLFPDEIVLVYDGPINSELETIVSEFQRNYPDTITIIKLQENQGLGIALAEGLKHVRNNIVARMDTDDVMVPDRLEKQFAVFEKYPDVAIVGSNINEFIGNLDNVIGKRIVPEKMMKYVTFQEKEIHLII